jgi:hypothetical protein
MHRNSETRICKALISNIPRYSGETWIMSSVEMTLAAIEQKILNPWITKQKNFIILPSWVHIVPILSKLFFQLFFQGSINMLN